MATLIPLFPSSEHTGCIHPSLLERKIVQTYVASVSQTFDFLRERAKRYPLGQPIRSFNIHSAIYRLHKIICRLNNIALFKRDICYFNIQSDFPISVSFLINIITEMSFPGLRTHVF